MPLPTKRRVRRAIVTDNDKVHVMVRLRPSKESEDRQHGDRLRADPTAHTVEGMAFDTVFDPATTQTRDVFDALQPTVDAWLQGYNGCVFAYGQTGSGKTHTMLGPDGGKKQLDGVIPMTVQYALEHIAFEQDKAARIDPNTLTAHRVRASYVELYNNELRDLLIGHPSAPATSDSVAVREDESGRVFLSGAVEVTVRTPGDLMALVQLGAQRRATGRTNMNEHSSRSHAVLTLHHQHRWKPADDASGKRLKQTEAALHLVDLAGSEYAKRTGNTGDQLKESVAINTGLFALGNVIAALAGHRDRRVGNHVPYRDSLLTRVLQSALGGDSRTVMIVCCSPAADDVTESLGSLRYAASARHIEAKAMLQVKDLQQDAGPLDNDLADPLSDVDRRCIWLEVPGFGDVYCRCAGDPVDGELLLFVHGSGPTNSSTFWNDVVWELAVRDHATPYYMVAIDCPGYGRSPGDRQTIRSLPGQFLTAVVNALGFRQALCLIGSSQGACSVFNATLENPSITRHVTVVHPVGHDVFRYSAIKQPCLLIFDTEDAGHPVKVGRWMRDHLPRCTYHEFAMSKQPYWPSDHVAVEIIKLVEGGPDGTGVKRPAAVQAASRFAEGAMGALQRLAGGLIGWCENKGYGEPIKPIGMQVLAPPSTFIFEEVGEQMLRDLTLSDVASTFATEDSRDAAGTEWIATLDPKTHRIFYTNVETLEMMSRKPRHGVVIVQPGDDDGAATAGATSAPRNVALFDDDVVEVAVEPTVEERLAMKAAQQAAEEAQTDCENCGEALGVLHPRRFKKCRHIVCELCFDSTALITGLCPVCHVVLSSVPAGKPKPAVDDAGGDAMINLVTKLSQDPRCVAREAAMQPELERRRKCSRIVLEYGNTAVGEPGTAMTVEAFMKIHSVAKGANKSFLVGPGSIECVGFNINPDFPKSAVKVRQSPFTLSRTMSTRFTCEMTVTFPEKCGIPPIAVPYSICHEPTTRRRVVVYVPSARGAEKPTGFAAKKLLSAVRTADVENTVELFL